MAVTTHTSNNGKVVIMSISGPFDFSVHEGFRKINKLATQRAERFIIDLGMTNRIYDSGLGMLLMLRQLAERNRSDIRIVNCSDENKTRFSDVGLADVFNIA